MILGLDLPALTITAVLVIYLMGGISKGATGFGLPLVTVSMLPFFIPIDLTLVLNTLVVFPLNIVQIMQAGVLRETLRRFWPVLIAIAAGVPVGAALVASVDPDRLVLFVGFFVMLFCVLTFREPKLGIAPRYERGAGGAFGLVAGVLSALTTTHGPPLVVYLVGLKVERRILVGALGLFLLTASFFVSAAYMTIGIVDRERFIFAVLCVVPCVLGMVIGNWLAGRVSQARFRQIVLALLFLLGANMVMRTLLG